MGWNGRCVFECFDTGQSERIFGSGEFNKTSWEAGESRVLSSQHNIIFINNRNEGGAKYLTVASWWGLDSTALSVEMLPAIYMSSPCSTESACCSSALYSCPCWGVGKIRPGKVGGTWQAVMWANRCSLKRKAMWCWLVYCGVRTYAGRHVLIGRLCKNKFTVGERMLVIGGEYNQWQLGEHFSPWVAAVYSALAQYWTNFKNCPNWLVRQVKKNIEFTL